MIFPGTKACNQMLFTGLRSDELPLYLFDKHCLGWEQENGGHTLADDYEVCLPQ